MELNTSHPMISTKTRRVLLGATLAVFTVIIFGLIWLFFVAPSQPEGFGWYLFSFASGLSMIVLPCTLPLAFVIVPLSMGKGVAKGLSIALAFGLGIAATLSIYGILAAIIGKTAIGTLGAPLETVKNWVYFIAGIFAFLFALGEIGLLKVKMPTYSGAAPAFIQKQQDIIKAFLLGLFLGNVGIGCPHPATPLLLIEIASSGQVFYGWTLFLVHAIGRVLPLLFLALLGILGVNGLSWVVSRREKVERATGWAMVFVAGFIMTLGLFTHDWWVNSGIHTQLEKMTQEETLLNILGAHLGTGNSHQHGIEEGAGLFSLPLSWGNWFLVLLWIFPIWYYYRQEKNKIKTIPENAQVPERTSAERLLKTRKWSYITLSILLAFIFVYFLPHNFLKHQTTGDHPHPAGQTEVDHNVMHKTMMEGGGMEAHMDEMMNHEDGAGTDATHDHSTPTTSTTPTTSSDGHDHSASQTTEGGGEMNMMMDMEEMMDHAHEAGTDASHAHGGGVAQVHEEGTVKNGLSITLDSPQNAEVGVPVLLAFNAVDLPKGTAAKNLELGHEKLMHVIGMRDDLSEFFHLHPEQISPGHFVIQHTFKKGGKYKIWTDVKQSGTDHQFGHAPFIVAGNIGTKETPKASINKIIGDHQVGIHADDLVAGVPMGIQFAVSDVKGGVAELENFLGAKMHLVVVKDDWSSFVHAHPSDHAHASLPTIERHSFINVADAHGAVVKGSVEVPFSVTFPTPGVYKVFGQFRPKGIDLVDDQSLVAEFYLTVSPNSFKVTWTHKFLISIVLIVLLSIAVKKYLLLK